MTSLCKTAHEKFSGVSMCYFRYAGTSGAACFENMPLVQCNSDQKCELQSDLSMTWSGGFAHGGVCVGSASKQASHYLLGGIVAAVLVALWVFMVHRELASVALRKQQLSAAAAALAARTQR